ncbi:MAG: aminoacyl-histidine dipeptidase [Deltaproteobacteria bacterium]|jgi:dipeptidase D|nr:aminoacyl-histidine dipeptidase [Deltaproteobacteria bacterium]
MSKSILDSEPKRFWHHFNEICKIPHESGNESALCAYLKKYGEDLGCEAISDSVGNLIIKKPAQNSNSTKTIVLQGHLDMVCEKVPGSNHDFAKDPIRPMIEGEWLTADGTSLGADDGVAIAASMAVMEDKDIKHGPLEFLFTVSEETGLDGAQGLDASLVEGRTMLNLDSEDDGVLFVGCAGGADSNVKIPFKRISLSDDLSVFELKISGLKGGHSGLVIHENRANAIKLIGGILSNLSQHGKVLVSSMDGGTRHNVIPSVANVLFAVTKSNEGLVDKSVSELTQSLKDEFSSSDSGLTVELSNAKANEFMDEDSSSKLIRYIDSSPYGVIKMSEDLENLVQTSTNLATVKFLESSVEFLHSSRSSSKAELEEVRASIRRNVESVGGKIEEPGGYPGWQPDMKSELLAFTKDVYKKLYNVEPKVTAIHAGLECGIIGEKLGGMDMISFGPELEDVHSPNERVKIDTCERFYSLITNLLEELAN